MDNPLFGFAIFLSIYLIPVLIIYLAQRKITKGKYKTHSFSAVKKNAKEGSKVSEIPPDKLNKRIAAHHILQEDLK